MVESKEGRSKQPPRRGDHSSYSESSRFHPEPGCLQPTIAQLNQNHATLLARLDQLERRTEERLARIEAILLEHTRVLEEHTRMLEGLPEAIRQKIGFKPSE